MGKFKKEIVRLKANDCVFFFYTTSGSYGMYCEQIRHKWFCIPFVIGFRYTVRWGG